MQDVLVSENVSGGRDLSINDAYNVPCTSSTCTRDEAEPLCLPVRCTILESGARERALRIPEMVGKDR